MNEESEPVVPTDFEIRLRALQEAVKNAGDSNLDCEDVVDTANEFYRFLKGE